MTGTSTTTAGTSNGCLRKDGFLTRVGDRRYATVQLHDGNCVMLRSVTEAEALTVDMRELDDAGETDRNRLRERRLATLTLHLIDPETKQRMFGFKDISHLRDLDSSDVNAIFATCVQLREGDAVAQAEKSSRAAVGE